MRTAYDYKALLYKLRLVGLFILWQPLLVGCVHFSTSTVSATQDNDQEYIFYALTDSESEPEYFEDTEIFFSHLANTLHQKEGRQKLIETGKKYLGTRYVFGGARPKSGFDCSGFTQYIYNLSLNMSLPRTARQMAQIGVPIEESGLKPGDLVFFNTRGFKYSHVGVYIDHGLFFHASEKRMPW